MKFISDSLEIHLIFIEKKQRETDQCIVKTIVPHFFPYLFNDSINFTFSLIREIISVRLVICWQSVSSFLNF